MRFIITGRHVAITPAFRSTIERKVGKLSRILPKIIEAKITLSAEKYRRIAELTLLVKGKILRSEETAGDLATAVDLAVDALARQVRQVKDRIRERKPRVSPRRPVAPSPREGEAAPVPPLVSRRVSPKPMSVQEAVMQLGLRRDQFLVFTNATTETVNVLYRRKNGGLGLIEPIA
jgi:putative sigma-54 modulation protein